MARSAEEVTVSGFAGLGAYMSPDRIMAQIQRYGPTPTSPLKAGGPLMVSPDRIMDQALRPGQTPPPAPADKAPPQSAGPGLPAPAVVSEDRPQTLAPVAPAPFYKNPMVLLGAAAVGVFLFMKFRR